MPIRIYIQSTIPDARAKVKKKQFESLGLKHKLGAVYLADCYTIDAQLNKQQIQTAKNLLANPIIESADTALRAPRLFNFAIEIGYLPGVTDNIGHTAKETLADGAKIKFKDGQNVYSSQILFIAGKISPGEVKKIAGNLHNPLIQRAAIKSSDEFKRSGGMDAVVPKVKLSASTVVSKVDLELADEELTKLGKLGIPETTLIRPVKRGTFPQRGKGGTTRRGPLSLSLDYLITIRDHFHKLGRQPTDVEIETLGQTWSEHCKHTIFADPMDELEKGIYKTYIKGATEAISKNKGSKDFCVSVFTDNAGGIIFDKNHLITHKVETHNTPSALDPFGGSITGIVGVNRDCLGFGLGAKPIINTYGFCFGKPDDNSKLYRDKNLEQPMLSTRRIMNGVIAGINAGGNQSGIPTNSGFVYFDDRYRGKPLVFAGTVGLIPRMINGKRSHIKQAKPNDLIVMVGGRVGADGIHGATFASEGLDKDSPATAVQIGDPITQKKFSDALAKEARDLGLYSSITDCGAGGLSSAVGEMAQATGGCLVNLDKVPLKYPGLAPWQIWISESQERMVLAVRPQRWHKLSGLLKKRGVEATIIGKFTSNGKCVVKFGKQTVLDLGLDFLHNGRPVKHQVTKQPAHVGTGLDLSLPRKKDYSDVILKLLSSKNLASTDFITTQYDHEVQAGSVLKPLQGRGRISAEATVTRPVLDSQKGLVLSYGINPGYSEFDPYQMAACAIDSAVRAAVAAGADVDYLALLDNFCWCSPEDPKRLWQLKEAARACYDVATAYGTPFISGKDSMYNDFKGFGADGKPIKISIPPTLLISAIGVIPDVTKSVSLDAKLPGDALYILGNTDDETGASSYMNMLLSPLPLEEGAAMHRAAGEGNVPTVNSAQNYQLYKTFYQAAQQNLIASAISISRGGLAIALIKTLMGGDLGAQISLADVPGLWTENYQALFSESQGRFLISVAPQNIAKFELLMTDRVFARLGKTDKSNKVTITDKSSRQIVNLKIPDALKTYKGTFKDF